MGDSPAGIGCNKCPSLLKLRERTQLYTYNKNSIYIKLKNNQVYYFHILTSGDIFDRYGSLSLLISKWCSTNVCSLDLHRLKEDYEIKCYNLFIK